MLDASTEQHEPDGFQMRGRAWNPKRPDIIHVLRKAVHTTIQPIYYGSNHTFLVTLDGGDDGFSLAVYKPSRGEYPLYDFANGTLYKREVATFLLDAILGWKVVPPTVVSTGKFGPGSLQIFIESVQEGEIRVEELRQLCLLDLLVNNADRKAEHLLLDDRGSLWGIDHGLTFHAQPKLRTVLWHFAGELMSEREHADLLEMSRELSMCRRKETREFVKLISVQERVGLTQRLQRLLKDGRFPNPGYKPVPYRW